MLRMFSCIWLLLLVICCWQCMARPKGGKIWVADDSSHSSSDGQPSDLDWNGYLPDPDRNGYLPGSGWNGYLPGPDRNGYLPGPGWNGYLPGSGWNGYWPWNDKKPATQPTGRPTAKTETTTASSTSSTSPKMITTTMLEITTTAAPETKAVTTTLSEITTTAAPETEVTTTAVPETEVTTTAAPETEVTTTTAPETEITTTMAPETEVTTTAAPETEVTTTAVPETEVTTTAAPETEVTTTTAPETEVTTTAVPETEATTTAASKTEGTTTEPLDIRVTTTPIPEITSTTSPSCDFECQNGGTCIDHNQCTCTTGFSGPTCEVQSVGLCLNDETFDTEPLTLITFGSGLARYSTATPASFNFTTTYKQVFQPKTNDGMFSFINAMEENSNAWHANATDHTGDENGYMYFINADLKAGQFYRGTVNDLCVGMRYEFSVYLANVCKPGNKIKPNVRFEVRSVVDDTLLAQMESGDIAEHNSLTWEKYGFSFIATSSSVNLLMISNARGGRGNDIVIDDIALRACSHVGSGLCPSN